MTSSILPTYNRTPLSFVKGEGAWLVEADGRRFLDMTAGIAVNALGHAHPKLVQALSDQAQKLWHVSNLYTIPEQERLGDLLTEHTFADRVFFTNSGTESAELAIKMARKYHAEKGAAHRVEIVAFEGAFHGRSTGAIAAAGSEKMVKGFGPLMPNFTHLKWGDHAALEAAITDQTCAVIIEPIQGEGGIRPVPEQCLKGLRDLCDKTGTVLIFDEVQCGMGRTGRLFAHEWAGVTPDIMMVAKGIGGGFPLGAVLATEDAGSGMVAGSHGSTYGGNPLACAVGTAVMEAMLEDGFFDHVSRVSGVLRQGLEGLIAQFPNHLEEVRGKGLMLGLKCKISNLDLVRAAQTQLMLSVPAADNVVRLLPPLTLTENEAQAAVSRLSHALETLDAGA
jgi:acetylornithine/N-succinyldiaminopimelate aminotransferase